MADSQASTSAEDLENFKFSKISSGFAESSTKLDAKQQSEPEDPTVETAEQLPIETIEDKNERKLKELEKAVARSKRFGGDSSDLEKKLERAQRFGIESVSTDAAGLKGLDQPLSERGEKRIRGRASEIVVDLLNIMPIS